MICILAGNYLEAEQWASGQMLEGKEWFYPADDKELLRRTNFHVVVVGTAGQNTPASYFNRILDLAQSRGRINRV